MKDRRMSRIRIENRRLRTGGAVLAAGMMLAGSFAVLPLQARETSDVGVVPYTQEGSPSESMSDNDARTEPLPEPMSDDDAQTEPSPEPMSDNDARTEPLPEPMPDDDAAAEASPEPNKSEEREKEEPPRITAEPEDATVEAGDYASFSVSASGEDLSYQWLVDKGDGSGFQKVKGAVFELYRVMVFDGSMNGYEYMCEVKRGKEVVRSRAARLTIFYRIVGGARAVWVKSSGRGLVFQGSGAYSRFSGVSVDGNRITAGEYNKGGSQTPFTEITLLRAYLETLSEGDHEMEIIWSDGTAKTSFRIEPPAGNLPAGSSGLGRVGADTEGSSRAAGTTTAVKDAAAAAAAADKGKEEEKGKGKEEEKEKEESAPARISGNTLDGSLSDNTVKPPTCTAADILHDSGVMAPPGEDKMTVTPGVRRTREHSPDHEREPVQLAVMSEMVDQYAGTICMAVILISAAGIGSGLLAYRLHDSEGRKR